SSRFGPRSSCGEIVEVQGGHIVRSTGRKDRHSKVCTAKGPRDRRVRLAAHTAIQFYDVQDRLGYDRPSKAVDWLIKKAKNAIDELAELPHWHPTSCSDHHNSVGGFEHHHDDVEKELEEERRQLEMAISPRSQQQNSSFLPPSLHSDSIADTIKSFFPMGGASAESSSSGVQQQFQNFPNQDLRLSLQSFQDPMLLHHHNRQQQQQQQQQQNISEQPQGHHHVQAQVLLSGTPLGFDGSWAAAEQQQHQHAAAEYCRLQRLAGWNPGGSGGGDNVNNSNNNSGSGGGAGFLFDSSPHLLGHTQFSLQRGPLQSSNTPSVRAWMDPSGGGVGIASAETSHHHQQQHHLLPTIYASSMQGIGFGSGGGVGSFSGFHIPARIQGDEEEHDGYSEKPSPASSDSRH
ncbi:hypothetical protein M569_16740, partial [Genlisea aurea]